MVSPEEVEKEIRYVNGNKAIGWDLISPLYLKEQYKDEETRPRIVQEVREMINGMISNGVHKYMNTGLLVLLKKKEGNNLTLNDCRTI